MKIKVSQIKVTPIGDGQWLLLEDVTIDFAGKQRVIKAGLKFDFASIPRWLKPFFPDDAIFSEAALVHDDAYSTGWVSKWIADALLAEMMDQKGRKIVGLLMWLGVVIGGHFAWNAHRAKDEIKWPRK